ncbi:hypothetical protein OSB04_015765 [Centaurea solstitialis]|uniref:Serine/threonine protein phosphatase 2A regulatory subunit n=1 Tax=Centaurea solstitialis TaxID=347529 RepID=A0AA38WGU5_9ASTR|nr:hypothetical protein OSB04_015765 [Centaurea solstitialis]
MKSTQGNKSGPLGSTQMIHGLNHANHGAYEPLPGFQDVPTSEKHNLFIRKLNMCCVVFDFSDPSENLEEMEVKRQTLLELLDYASSVKWKFDEVMMMEITKMVVSNLFRSLTPSSIRDKELGEDPYDSEDDDELSMEPSWPHLQIVYEFLLRFVASPQTDAKLTKRYIDPIFVSKLLHLFDSEDPREREYLKLILHRIYKKFMVHRPFIRKAINNVFYRFIFETEKHNGIAELLEMLGSVINGFTLPLKEEHKVFLMRTLVPLHKPRCLSMYHQQLTYCITKFVEKDFKLADVAIRGLLKYWPITNSSKEVMYLGELEEVLESTHAAEFQRCMVPLFRQIGRCCNSSHSQMGYSTTSPQAPELQPVRHNPCGSFIKFFPGKCLPAQDSPSFTLSCNIFGHENGLLVNILNPVAERALCLWNHEHITNLITQNCKVILPIIFPALEKNTRGHWNQVVRSLTLHVRLIFSDADQSLFDECVIRYQEDELKEKENRKKRESTWMRLENVAASKSIVPMLVC